MKDNQKESSGLNREEYAAPDYRRFVFETSCLIQTSGAHLTALGGDFRNDASSSSAASAFGVGAEEW